MAKSAPPSSTCQSAQHLHRDQQLPSTSSQSDHRTGFNETSLLMLTDSTIAASQYFGRFEDSYGSLTTAEALDIALELADECQRLLTAHEVDQTGGSQGAACANQDIQ